MGVLRTYVRSESAVSLVDEEDGLREPLLGCGLAVAMGIGVLGGGAGV
jgi:hypothetical protein